jgi:hypothetical protein|tara:strand:- start:299 stop:517 length:219 start_codon:yes stop_codon:yes gene_type:complete
MSNPRAEAQSEAERTFEQFLLWTKRATMYSVIFLMVVVVGCNSGVEVGPNKTGSQYNGEQYSPSNLNVKDKK